MWVGCAIKSPRLEDGNPSPGVISFECGHHCFELTLLFILERSGLFAFGIIEV